MKYGDCRISRLDPIFFACRIQERTKAGLSAARAGGRKGGRKPITGDDPGVKTACRMHRDHELSVEQICKTLDISRATFRRYLAVATGSLWKR